MTAQALKNPDQTSATMAQKYQQRIEILTEAFAASTECGLAPLRPQSGMFMLVDVSATGKTGAEFADALLDFGVAVMPGSSFGDQAGDFIRLSLTVADDDLREAAQRIVKCANEIRG